MARSSMIDGKMPEHRLQGIMSLRGWTLFNDARRRLGRLYRSIMGRPILPEASDSDTIEYLVRGEAEMRQILEAKARRGGRDGKA